MNCSGCGKTIPFAGQVCPYCQRDKSGDQHAVVVGFFFAAIGCGIGYLFSHELIGILFGCVAGVIIGQSTKKKSLPPEVRWSEGFDTPSRPIGDVTARLEQLETLGRHPKPVSGIKDRLAQLETLRIEGIISDNEYSEKRQTILNLI